MTRDLAGWLGVILFYPAVLAMILLCAVSCDRPTRTITEVQAAGELVRGWTDIANGGNWLGLLRLPQGTCVAVLVGYTNGGKALVVVPDKECQ
jgi:hypothetical protein